MKERRATFTVQPSTSSSTAQLTSHRGIVRSSSSLPAGVISVFNHIHPPPEEEKDGDVVGEEKRRKRDSRQATVRLEERGRVRAQGTKKQYEKDQTVLKSEGTRRLSSPVIHQDGPLIMYSEDRSISESHSVIPDENLISLHDGSVLDDEGSFQLFQKVEKENYFLDEDDTVVFDDIIPHISFTHPANVFDTDSCSACDDNSEWHHDDPYRASSNNPMMLDETFDDDEFDQQQRKDDSTVYFDDPVPQIMDQAPTKPKMDGISMGLPKSYLE
ncbi:hypothetical protein ADUPG1_000614 [Aduncisulcus paluster]|uniref:Uncharacterized protein n=1 Tax=Aduncisulcus paluster TaxID=2918883 RepID=A0ABQ5K730_9EUKA|nr:hypothetical protein ADUPG1_000614 [Aduncisulcus paluster]